MAGIFGNGRYANVTATMALVVALGGSAYAANTVRSTDIKNGEVKRVDLANNAVTSGKVKNGALLSRDFKAGQIPAGQKGATGATGATGPKGDKGDKGDAGAPATALWASVTGAGVLGRNSHAVSSSDLGTSGNGSYEVVFDRDVTGCIYLGTVGGPESVASAGQISITRLADNPNALYVVTYTGSGSASDRSFYVGVFC